MKPTPTPTPSLGAPECGEGEFFLWAEVIFWFSVLSVVAALLFWAAHS